MPRLFGLSLCRLDIHIRASAAIGIVVVGGFGAQLNASLNLLAWPQVALIIRVVLASFVRQWVSARVRHAIV